MNSQNFSLKSHDLVMKAEGISIRVIDDTALLIRRGHNHPFRLNKSGTKIWELMDHHQRVGDIIDSFCESFQVEKDQAVADVIPFLGKLMERGLVKIRMPSP